MYHPKQVVKLSQGAISLTWPASVITKIIGSTDLPSGRAFLGELREVDRNLGALLLVLLVARLNEVGIGRHLALGLPGVPFSHTDQSRGACSPLTF